MYMPATRNSIAEELVNHKHKSLTTVVVDLEDALSDDMIEEGVNNLFLQMQIVKEAVLEKPSIQKSLPLIFIRVRHVEMLEQLLSKKEVLSEVTGFILPKFSSSNGGHYLKLIQQANIDPRLGRPFYAMPVLETPEIIYKETRLNELTKIKEIINSYEDIILNVRLGGTDFSGLFSIRRTIDTTIYDVAVVKDCICDILNFFNRGEDDFVVSGVVWEFFSTNQVSDHNRILKPTLRETPFKNIQEGLKERNLLIDQAIDGLIKEVLLDRTNGIIGKTIIHPSHIRVVNAMQVVTEEEYNDASMILGNSGKGVLKSDNGNKMNEMKPHLNWARKIIEKSKVYGVLKNGESFYKLF